MGILPCDHPQRGTGEVRPRSATLSGPLGPCIGKGPFDQAKDFYALLWKIPHTTYIKHNQPSMIVEMLQLQKRSPEKDLEYK